MGEPKKLTRYEARTLGGGANYSLEPEDDGPLCSAWEVEDLEARVSQLEGFIGALHVGAHVASRLGTDAFAEVFIQQLQKRLPELATVPKSTDPNTPT